MGISVGFWTKFSNIVHFLPQIAIFKKCSVLHSLYITLIIKDLQQTYRKLFANLSELPGIRSWISPVEWGLVRYGLRYSLDCNRRILLILGGLVLEHDRGPYFSLGCREWEAPFGVGGI